jgi:hypothetical protein
VCWHYHVICKVDCRLNGDIARQKSTGCNGVSDVVNFGIFTGERVIMITCIQVLNFLSIIRLTECNSNRKMFRNESNHEQR